MYLTTPGRTALIHVGVLGALHAQPRCKRLVPAGGGDLILDATFAVPIQAELFVRQGDIPRPDRFDFSANDLADQTRQIVVRSPQAGSYFVLVRGREGAAIPQNFTLAARLAGFEIRNISGDRGSNVGSPPARKMSWPRRWAASPLRR